MFRTLILFSAICILLLVGYIAMEKGSFTNIKDVVDVDKVLSDIKEKMGDKDKPSTSDASDKSEEIVEPILNETTSTLEKSEQEEENKDIVEDFKKDTQSIEAPVFKTPEEKKADEYVDTKSKQWELLEETQKVLVDVGEMLK